MTKFVNNRPEWCPVPLSSEVVIWEWSVPVKLLSASVIIYIYALANSHGRMQAQLNCRPPPAEPVQYFLT